MAKLAKSLAELDALADELLLKSKTAEDNDDKVTPEEIVDENVQNTAEEDSTTEEEENKDEEDKEVKKSEEVEDLEKGAGCDGCADGDNDVKKSVEASEDETEDTSEDEEANQEDIEKSIKEDFEANETIAKGMEASEFLTAVVEVLSKGLSDVQYDLIHGHKGQSSANEVLAKSLQASLAMNSALRADNDKLTRRINKLEKSMSVGFDKIMDALDDISIQPAGMRKSVSSVAVHDRNFGASLEGTNRPSGFDSLSKSQVMAVLEAELVSGNPSVTASDIIGYESGAPIRQDLQQLVASKCK